MSSDLRALRDIIVSSVDTIIDAYEQANLEFPSLDEPVRNADPKADELRRTSVVINATKMLVASAAQLTATVQDPSRSLMLAAYNNHFSVSLSVVEAGNVAEILREAGEQGMNIRDLAKRSGMHAKKLATVMHFLVTKHVFRELAPDVFVNNSISSLLDSGLPSEGLNTESKLAAKQGMAAEIEFTTNTGLRTYSYLSEAMTHPDFKYSEEPNEGAFQLSKKTDLAFFEWLSKDENAVLRQVYGRFMSGAVVTQPAASVLSAFDWKTLKPGSMVCDIGGGLGHVSLEIAKAFPELNVVVQDLPRTANDAKRSWEEKHPEIVKNGRIVFHGASFFEPQPIRSTPPEVFLLRFILHDWSDKYAIKILQRLREAASSSTRLVIIDTIVEHTCEVNETDRNPFVGVPPTPLLQNWGEANVFVYNVGIAVLASYNAGERTKENFEELFAASGWKLEEIRWQAIPGVRPSLVASPM